MQSMFFQSLEGKILLIGLLLLTLLFALFTLTYLLHPNMLNALLQMSIANPTIGRVASLTIGVASKIDAVFLIAFNLLLEMIQVFILYPLFVTSWKKASTLNLPSLQNYFDKAKTTIEKYKPNLQKYGILGLILFVLTPLAMTGPTVGSFAGFVIGYKHSKTLSIIFIATLISMSLWYLLILNFEQSLVLYSNLLMQGLYILLAGLGVWFLVKRFIVKL